MAILKNTSIQDTSFIKIATGPSSERPSSPELGMVRFNTDSEKAEIYNGTQWQKIISGTEQGLVDFPEGIEINGGTSVSNGLVSPSSGKISIFTAGQEQLSIDSVGRMTMNNQPLFEVGRGAGSPSGSVSPWIWDVVFEDIGNNFNTGNGRFTAPVSGIYFFSWFSITGANSERNELRFFVNGNRMLLTRDDTRNNRWQTVSAFWFYFMNEGDYIEARQNRGRTYGNSTLWNRWMGYLIN